MIQSFKSAYYYTVAATKTNFSLVVPNVVKRRKEWSIIWHIFIPYFYTVFPAVHISKVHKQGEHIPQLRTFHTTIPIHKQQLILILCHLACHCYLCRYGRVKCSDVVECALLVCVPCQPMHPSIHPSLHFVDFFKKIILNFLFLLFFVMRYCPRTCG